MALHLIDHPLVQHKLSIMRDKNTSTNKFRELLKEISMFMGYEVTRDFPLTYEEIENILEFKLPSTAYNLPRTYWANTLTHTYATSWMLVGYKTKVNVSDMSVTFEKIIY